jgi:hypothetical protein
VLFIGAAKNGREAIAQQARLLLHDNGAGSGSDARVVCAELPKTSRRPQLQSASAAWLTQCGYLPVGNQSHAEDRGSDQGQQRQGQQQQQGQGQVQRNTVKELAGVESEVASRAAAAVVALAVVSEEAVRALCTDGFVVIDHVLPPAVMSAALAAAERLRLDGWADHLHSSTPHRPNCGYLHPLPTGHRPLSIIRVHSYDHVTGTNSRLSQ